MSAIIDVAIAAVLVLMVAVPFTLWLNKAIQEMDEDGEE